MALDDDNSIENNRVFYLSKQLGILNRKTEILDVIVQYHAKKHGVLEQEILYAWEHALKSKVRNSNAEPSVTVAVGPTPNGTLIQMMGSLGRDGHWRIYHAMKLTKKVKRELDF